MKKMVLKTPGSSGIISAYKSASAGITEQLNKSQITKAVTKRAEYRNFQRIAGWCEA